LYFSKTINNFVSVKYCAYAPIDCHIIHIVDADFDARRNVRTGLATGAQGQHKGFVGAIRRSDKAHETP
jgi:hypothetical protein